MSSLPTACAALCLFGVAFVACGDDPPADGARADAGPGPAEMDGATSGGSGQNPDASEPPDGAPPPTTLGFTRLVLADRVDDAPCSGAVGAATIGHVAFAQTHVMAPEFAFFYLTGARPALLLVDAVGSGAAPEVSVEASVGGAPLGKKCLRGPAQLPAALDPSLPDRENHFSVTLPAAWLTPGLSLTVKAGDAVRTLTATELRIGAAPIVTFLTADFALFGDVTTHSRAGVLEEFLAKSPFAALNHAHLAEPFALPRIVTEPDSGGQTPSGAPAPAPAQWADRAASCSDAEKAAGTCTTYGGFAIIATVRHMLEVIARANGLARFVNTYADIGPAGGVEGSGLGGGRITAGGGYGLVFNHEVGHGFGFPHWGDVSGTRATNPQNRFPYAGDFTGGDGLPQGGGFGSSWAYDALSGALLSPACPLDSKERQDPMQRAGACADPAALEPGRVFDPYSDFSAFGLYRYYTGGAAQTGTVSYRGGNAEWGVEERSAGIEWADLGKNEYRHWDLASGAYVRDTSVFDDTDYPAQIAMPSYLIHGAFHLPSDTLSTIYPPRKYLGNLMRPFDPTNATDLADMQTRRLAYYGWDLTVRVEYTDGTVRHVLVPVSLRGDGRNDPLSIDSTQMWAVNVPADKELKRATLFYRPLATRDAGDPIEGNVGAGTISAENVLDGARQAARFEVP